MADASLLRILTEHARRYPLLGVQDLYKLIHQAAMGSEHAVSSVALARNWLEEEVASLASSATVDPLVDPISPDGSIARIHLRPYVASGLGLEALLSAFVGTANEHHGSVQELARFWSVAECLAASGLFGFDPREMDRFFAEMAASGFPPAHHSAAYEAAYRPAYRVVKLTLLEGLPETQHQEPR